MSKKGLDLAVWNIHFTSHEPKISAQQQLPSVASPDGIRGLDLMSIF